LIPCAFFFVSAVRGTFSRDEGCIALRVG
jgi:hypothetical protein